MFEVAKILIKTKNELGYEGECLAARIKMASSFFQTRPKAPAAAASANKTSNTANTYSLPPTDNPDISAFYAQLSDKERIAHAIAVDKLGTSYDVTRTHGFLKWLKKRASAAPMSS
jgi:hypothetical protein